MSLRRIDLDGTHHVIRGATGSGKSLLLTRLATQYIEAYERDGVPCLNDPIFIIDGGGDLYLYNSVRETAARHGRTFRTFSLDPSESDFFDPLQVSEVLAGNVARMGAYLSAGLNVVYSQGYGRSFFGRMNQASLIQSFERLWAQGVTTPTLLDLAAELRHIARESRSRETSEAVFAVEELLHYPQLVDAARFQRSINVAQALEESWVVYFFCPTLLEPLPARAIQALASWSIVIGAVARSYAGESRPPRYVRLFHDEFAQTVGAKSFEDVLTLSRKAAVLLTLAHQSSEQLRTSDGDLRPILRDNCAVKVFFSSSTRQDDEELLQYSKTTVMELQGRSSGNFAASFSARQQVVPVLQLNTIRDVTNTRFNAFFIRTDGSGHHEPEPIVCQPVDDRATYERLRRLPLPRRVAGTGNGTRSPSTTSPRRRAVDPQASATRQQALGALLTRLRAAENWRGP